MQHEHQETRLKSELALQQGHDQLIAVHKEAYNSQQTANQLEHKLAQVRQELLQIKQEMTDLQSPWQSPCSEDQ